jgi:hypothetical protein
VQNSGIKYDLLKKIGKEINIIGDMIDIGVSLSSFTENLAQNDDAAIADAIQFSGAALGLIAFTFSIPVLGWVAGLTGLAAWAAKAFLFKEDTPVEIWLANGPFVRGNEYHEHFAYRRSTDIIKVRDANGDFVDTACTVHSYDDFEFLVDIDNILVGYRPAFINLPYYGRVKADSGFKVTPDGTVILKANPEKNIHADTKVAKIGEPF